MFHCHVGSRRIDHAVLRGALSLSLSLSLTTMGSTLRTNHPERFGSSDSIAVRQEWTKRQTGGGERGGNETDVCSVAVPMFDDRSLCATTSNQMKFASRCGWGMGLASKSTEIPTN
jgi:hypothetical protein